MTDITDTVIECVELKEFIFAARDCLFDRENEPFKGDNRYDKAVEGLSRLPGPMLVKYNAILARLTEGSPNLTMKLICNLYAEQFKERLTPG